ncbi:hypothetical protein E2P63_08665 [Candidatus Bathyarchaeota archaeon]|nr:hypothetical protein E2P63_08665 [Candidatus Bathyarchaeota archaeon]
MVKKAFSLTVILALAVASLFVGLVSAQNRIYDFSHEWAQIFINQDGTIDLTYNVTLTLSSGDDINFVRLGQPKGDFTIGEAADQYGHKLETSDSSSGNNYQVQVNLYQSLTAGNTIWFTVTTNVAGMIYNDTQNQGNYGLQFAPQWMQEVTVSDVRVQIVLPPNVAVNEVKTLPDKFWNSTSTVEGRTAVFWQIPVLQPNEKYLLGVSFPASALPNYSPTQSSGGFGLETIALIVLPIIALIVIVVVVQLARKSSYSSPKVSMETLGIRRGLTAVEASYLLGMKPTQIVTEILYSLLQKRAVWVESASPSLKLRVMPDFKNKTGTEENPLRYYEIDFLHALKGDGVLDEEKLAHTVVFLRETLEQKLRGYSRRDTVDYYRKIVTKAWLQVEQAGTVDLASKAFDEQLLWLMLDPNYRTRTETAFRDRTFAPSPLWLWYWYGYSHYTPNPTYKPNINTPTQAAKTPIIPGAEFANNIATAVEKTSSNIVTDIEKFANAIIPAKEASHTPARHDANCVCACHACACACACVSCACACAGGGVG